MNKSPSLACLLLTLLSPALWAQGTSTVNAGWYNGDCPTGIPGSANWYLSSEQFGRVYDDFVVPTGGWTVAGVFSINHMTRSDITEAVWEIRSGISAGNGGAVVASGRSPATQTLTTIWPDGEKIYRIEADGLRVQLAPGMYWLSVNPIAGYQQSYVCATLGKNATGNPAGNDGQAFYYAAGPTNHFFQAWQSTGQTGTSGDYSHGVLIYPSSAAFAPPVITSIVNAASWQAGPLSPGEIVTITGTNLGPLTLASLMLDHNGKVSTTLDGVQVLVGGFPAPQIYVSGTQINAVVPYEIAGVANPSTQVKVGGQTSNPFPVRVAATAPAFFTANGSGTGPAAALNQDYSYNDPSHPAERGSYVVLYLTGEGQTSPAGVTGKVTTISSVAPVTPQPLSPVTVLVGGQPAYVAFYGEAPGLVSGVLQVNIQIPANVPSGDLPISLSVGAASSTQTGVTISVR